jgi:uracil-DNA glycosylase
MERLDDLEEANRSYTPAKRDLFRALSLCPYDAVRVLVLGQDPYPNQIHATGVAFEVQGGVRTFPPTLQNIFKEYESDLRYPFPKSGDLSKWCEQGVLLWNAIPLHVQGEPVLDWPELRLLTEEIVGTLSQRTPAPVMVFLGSIAREFTRNVVSPDVVCLEFSHPSPRGSINSRSPFLGSRLFSTINAKLVEKKQPTIDWRLE